MDCQLVATKSGDFQDIPLHVKVADAVSIFGIYVRFTIGSSEEQQVQPYLILKNSICILIAVIAHDIKY